jgi:hypothetical protein
MKGIGTVVPSTWIISTMLIILIAIVLFVFRPITPVSPVETYVNVTFCPEKTKYYISAKGDEECCDGEVSGDRCIGTRVCTMSSSKSLPSCKDMMSTYFSEKAARVCPADMPYYYEVRGGVGGACTSSKLSAAMLPLYPSAPSCTVYRDGKDNVAKADSCYNQKQLSDMKCITPKCKKMLVPIMAPNGGAAMLTTQTFMVKDSIMPHTCYGRESVLAAGYSSSLVDTHPAICENANRTLIERRAA